ncbi:MAG: efflux RND transporter periplasmic adaptor subunit [Phycisphaera sp.]|nr:MAG: efflux RND transporter periplasmic adaptor subunit [Phycisphaera sp.]
MNAKSSRTLRIISLFVRAGVAVLIILIAGGIFSVLMSMRVDPERNPSESKGIPVRTITTTAVSVPRVWEGYGTVRAMNSSTISAQLLARVIERPEEIEAGLELTEGQLIVRLDSADAISRVQAAEASIASFQAQLDNTDAQEARLREQIEHAVEERDIDSRNLDRVREAAQGGAGTDADIDTRISALRRSERALAALEQQLEVLPARRDEIRALQSNARASLALAQEDLERATIVSPMDGILQDVYVEEGELLNVGDQVARIVDLTKLEIPLRMPISAAATIREGDLVNLRSDGPVDTHWQGEVSRIAPEADAASRTMTVFVEVAQDPSRLGLNEAVLLPGQFVIGRVETSERSPRVLVPRRAVSADRVMMVGAGEQNGNRVVPTDIRVSHYINGRFESIDPDETEWAVVESGLDQGERIIVSNLDVLVGGMLISPDNGSGGAPASASAQDAGGGS